MELHRLQFDGIATFAGKYHWKQNNFGEFVGALKDDIGSELEILDRQMSNLWSEAKTREDKVRAQAATSEDIAILDKSSKAFVNVVKRAKPAVVHIKVEKTTTSKYRGGRGPEDMFNHPFFDQFFGPQYRQQQPKQPKQQEFTQRGQGSGFIISKDGFILTNNHVVEGADTIKVTLSDDRDFTAKVIGTDPQTDVALIKIEDPKNLPVLPLGDSSKLEAGEWVIAIQTGIDTLCLEGNADVAGRQVRYFSGD